MWIYRRLVSLRYRILKPFLCFVRSGAKIAKSKLCLAEIGTFTQILYMKIRLVPGLLFWAITFCHFAQDSLFIRQIYDEALAYVDKLIITEVDTEVDGDAFFPDVDDMMWEEIAREEHNNGQLAYAFVTYNSKL